MPIRVFVENYYKLIMIIIGALSLFITLLLGMGVPKKDQSYIKFLVRKQNAVIPKGLDGLIKVKADSILSIDIINKGERTAKEVKISFLVGGEIVSIESTPSKQEGPVWVDLSEVNLEFYNEKKYLRMTGLAPSKKVHIDIKYCKGIKDFEEKVEIFYDGKIAKKIGFLRKILKIY